MQKTINNAQMNTLAALFAVKSCDTTTHLKQLDAKEGIKGVKYVQKSLLKRREELGKKAEDISSRIVALNEVQEKLTDQLEKAEVRRVTLLIAEDNTLELSRAPENAMMASLKRTRTAIEEVKHEIRVIKKLLSKNREELLAAEGELFTLHRQMKKLDRTGSMLVQTEMGLREGRKMQKVH